MMWYGVLGTKELLHRTYKNLEQKVLLEVSGAVSGLSAWLLAIAVLCGLLLQSSSHTMHPPQVVESGSC